MQRTCFAGSPVSQFCFWLMIVSIAIVVLPVERSPMISWRWPRPIGVIESMALMPVASGSCTDLRSITVGAGSSRARRLSDAISPSPSIGVPSGSTTRPMKPSPTGTERISPVRRTVWPSSILSKSPRTTTPISRVSRLSAMPRVPSSNSSSSLAIAEGRPLTRAMPSPACATVPTSSLEAASGWYSETNRCSASRISSGRIESSVISASLLSWALPLVWLVCVFCVRGAGAAPRGSAGQLASGVVEAGGHGAVDDVVTDLDPQAAEQRGLDLDVQVHGPAVLGAERVREAAPLGVRQVPRRAHQRDTLALGRGGDLLELGDRGVHRPEGARERLLGQRHRGRERAPVEQLPEQAALVLAR